MKTDMKNENINSLIMALSSSNDWYSCEELSTYLHMTPRTIRNYVREINDLNGETMVLSSRKGYRINRNTSYSLFLKTDKNDLDTPEKRQAHILRELSFRDTVAPNTPFSIEDLCDRLMVSYRTIEADLESVRSYLRNFSISLHMKNDNLSISGEEICKRRLIYDSIFNANRDSGLTFSILSRIDPTLDISLLNSIVIEALRSSKLNIDDYHILPLLLYMIIQIMRIRNNRLTKINDISIPDIQNRKEYTSAEIIAERLNHHFELNFPFWELSYLAMILICMCNDPHPDIKEKNEIYQMVLKTINHLENHENISYHENRFPEIMTDFFYRSLISCQNGIEVRNPLRSSLRNSSAITQDRAAWIIGDVENRFHVSLSADQIAFFSMLLMTYREKRIDNDPMITCTLISPDYYDFNQMLFNKIRTRFNKQLKLNDKIINSLPMKQQKSDMYISLMNAGNLPHAVRISPILSENDQHMIQNEIYSVSKEKRCRNFEMFLRSYSRKEFFEKNHDLKDRDDVIRYISKKLLAAEYVKDNFEESVLYREKIDPTSFHHVIAIPHGSAQSVLHNSIYILLNEKAIQWGKEKVNLIVLIAMERELNEDYQQFYDLLVQIFEDKKVIRKLLESKDYDSFLDNITASASL